MWWHTCVCRAPSTSVLFSKERTFINLSCSLSIFVCIVLLQQVQTNIWIKNIGVRNVCRSINFWWFCWIVICKSVRFCYWIKIQAYIIRRWNLIPEKACFARVLPLEAGGLKMMCLFLSKNCFYSYQWNKSFSLRCTSIRLKGSSCISFQSFKRRLTAFPFLCVDAVFAMDNPDCSRTHNLFGRHLSFQKKQRRLVTLAHLLCVIS